MNNKGIFFQTQNKLCKMLKLESKAQAATSNSQTQLECGNVLSETIAYLSMLCLLLPDAACLGTSDFLIK